MTQTQPTSQSDGGAADSIAAALGRIPSGLFVVTWRAAVDDGVVRDRGMLASWIMQGGFAPPLVTVAVATSRDLLSALDDSSPFVVNVLGEPHRGLLARFGKPAGPGEDPFAGLPLVRSPGGVAALVDSVAWLECRAVERAGGGGIGDHVIVLARVDAAGTATEQPPLVHTRRNGLRY